MVEDHKQIRDHYLFTVENFAVDLLGNLPIELLVFALPTGVFDMADTSHIKIDFIFYYIN